MSQGTELLEEVAPFPMTTFRSHMEFESYLREKDSLRGLRWLHERSLATTAERVVLEGVCGLCLVPTTFTAFTRGGEDAPNGRVPNWREGLSCGCQLRLINRERALLHFLATEGILNPWTRVLALGEITALQPILTSTSKQADYVLGSLATAITQVEPPRKGYHLILSVEQLTSRDLQSDLLFHLGQLLAPGGAFVFTAPFDFGPPPAAAPETGPIGWRVLDALIGQGFSDAKACTFWSEEYGYLGAFNFIFSASKP